MLHLHCGKDNSNLDVIHLPFVGMICPRSEASSYFYFQLISCKDHIWGLVWSYRFISFSSYIFCFHFQVNNIIKMYCIQFGCSCNYHLMLYYNIKTVKSYPDTKILYWIWLVCGAVFVACMYCICISPLSFQYFY